MIPLLSISQTKYIIDKDTIIGYTSSENRSIGLLFLEGEHYKELYFNEDILSNLKDSVITTQNYHIIFLDSMLVVKTKLLTNINNEYVYTQKELNKVIEKNKTKNNLLKGSIIANIILIITLLIK